MSISARISASRWLGAGVRAALLAVALGVSCISPTIPIPPPEPTAMTFTDLDPVAGVARFTYARQATYAGAIVYIFNRDAGEGIITTADPDDGSVGPTAPFPAVEEDEIVVTFEVEGQLASTCVRLRAGPSDASRRCN